MLTQTDFAKIQNFVEIYKEKEPTERETLRGEVFVKMESAVSPTEREWYGEMLQKMQAVESLPVQRVEITLPDIPAQTFMTLGKYGLLVGAGCIIGAVIVALIVETVAFIAAYGVYLVVAVVVVLLLKSLTWRGERDEYKEENPTNQQNIIINVTASNGGSVTVNKETT